jgi:hypothetical protein
VRSVRDGAESFPVLDAAAAADLLRAHIPLVRGRSALSERLLAGLAGATERGFDGGVLPRLLGAAPGRDAGEVLLLVLAALHHSALVDPELPHAAWYPTAVDEPRPPDEGAPAALALAFLVEREAEVGAFVAEHRLQTNEVGRCAALLPGLLTVAERGLPLRVLEVGTAAGLNLRFDRYRYRYVGGPTWGHRGGPELESTARGAVPDALVPPSVDVIDRRGVDLQPIDPTDPDGARLLRSFVWADDHERHARLERAITIAGASPASLDRGDLVAWMEEHLVPTEGCATVLIQSLVAHQLDADTAWGAERTAERALRAATADAPVATVRLEPPPGISADPELAVTICDGSGPPRRTTVLTADEHGKWVRWW